MRPTSQSWLAALPSVGLVLAMLAAVACLSCTGGSRADAQPAGSQQATLRLSDPAVMAHDRDRSRHLSPAEHARALKLFDGAFSLYQAGDFDAAQTGFERGLGIDPGNSPANFYLGALLARANDIEGARAGYTRAKFFDPDSPEALKAEVALSKFPPPPQPEPPIHPMVAGLRDCDRCPSMTRIPAGSFVMGTPRAELERAMADESLVGGPPDVRRYRLRTEEVQHPVSVRAFRLGIYPVTFAEWDACVTDGGCRGYRPKDGGWGRGQRPLIHVSWDDAHAYLNWISGKAGRSYRLPTEAEWEYAARAGTTTARYWGDEVGIGNANCNGCGSFWDYSSDRGSTAPLTAPVGQLRPNAFGLYDMLGNVGQMVADCWHDSYAGAPADGSARLTGCLGQSAVERGGGWFEKPNNIRAGYREGCCHDHADREVNYLGFRVARDE